MRINKWIKYSYVATIIIFFTYRNTTVADMRLIVKMQCNLVSKLLACDALSDRRGKHGEKRTKSL